MSNNLPRHKQVAVLNALAEGCSVRSTSRLTDVNIPTVLSLLVRAGEGCETLHDKAMRDLPLSHVECDEIWSFVGKKQRMVKPEDDPAEAGDIWTFVAIDGPTKLIPAYRVGKRDGAPRTPRPARTAGRPGARLRLRGASAGRGP